MRAKEDWEYIYPPMMALGFVLFGIIYTYRPHYNMNEWARIEALKRLSSDEEE